MNRTRNHAHSSRSLRLTHPFAIGIVILLGCQLMGVAAYAQWVEKFSRIPAISATDTQRQEALFFRSTYVENGASTAPLLSLNPADATLAPAILDSSTGNLTALQIPAGLVDGVEIVRSIEVGIFSGHFAAAKTVIRESSKVREAWGYVDRVGRWVVAPHYDRAETPVNRWAKVGVLESNSNRIRQQWIIDLERQTKVDLPKGRVLRYDSLVPIGPHVAFTVDSEDSERSFNTLLLNAMTGAVLQLPSYPPPQAESTGMLLMDNHRVFDIATGRTIPSPDAQYSYNWILPGVITVQNQIGDRLDIQIFKPATQTTLIKNLHAAEPLTQELFVACDQGENAWPVVRRGQQDPYPFDANSKLRCGLMDAQARWRVPSRYQHFYVLDSGQIVMRGAGEWCVLDQQAASVPVCSEKVPAAMLRSGLWLDVEKGPVDSNGNFIQLYGYRDGSNKLVIPFLFDRATPFAGQIASVNQLGNLGLMNPKGRWLTPAPPSHVVQMVLEGNARSLGTPCEQCFGLIDRAGHWVWAPVFNQAKPAPQPDRFWVRGHGDNPWLEADTQGRARRAPVSVSNRDGNTEPSVQLLPNRIVATGLNGLWGLTDTAGAWLVSARFLAVDVVSATRAIARTKEGLGLIDSKSTWLMKPRFARLEALNDGFIVACTTNEGSCETFDMNGVRIDLADELSAAQPFDTQGVAAAQVRSSGLWGYLDRKGRWQIAPMFTKAYPFSGKFAMVQAARGIEVDPSLPTGQGSPYLVSGIGLWPKAKLATVSVIPNSFLQQAQERHWYWNSNSQNKSLTGLMDTQGQWLVPIQSQWPVSR